jgi:hypothetical protein
MVKQSCQKCGGNIFFFKDHYGAYTSCLQCGKSHDLPRDFQFHTSFNSIIIGNVPKLRVTIDTEIKV